MYDSGKIIAGLIIFLALATFPLYYNIGKANAKPEPKIDTPVIEKMAVKKCVEPKEYMRAEHMKVLNEWRDSVLRDGKRIYVSADGENYDMSVQNKCFDCHSNKKKFCDACHNYLAVKPFCWDCHLVPKEDES